MNSTWIRLASAMLLVCVLTTRANAQVSLPSLRVDDTPGAIIGNMFVSARTMELDPPCEDNDGTVVRMRAGDVFASASGNAVAACASVFATAGMIVEARMDPASGAQMMVPQATIARLNAPQLKEAPNEGQEIKELLRLSSLLRARAELWHLIEIRKGNDYFWQWIDFLWQRLQERPNDGELMFCLNSALKRIIPTVSTWDDTGKLETVLSTAQRVLVAEQDDKVSLALRQTLETLQIHIIKLRSRQASN